MKDTLISQRAKTLLKHGEMDKLFKILIDTVSPNSNLYSLLISAYSRNQDIEIHYRNGTMHSEVLQVEKNRIRYTLLEIINQLEEEDIESDLEIRVTLKNKASLWERIVNWFRNLFS